MKLYINYITNTLKMIWFLQNSNFIGQVTE